MILEINHKETISKMVDNNITVHTNPSLPGYEFYSDDKIMRYGQIILPTPSAGTIWIKTENTEGMAHHRGLMAKLLGLSKKKTHTWNFIDPVKGWTRDNVVAFPNTKTRISRTMSSKTMFMVKYNSISNFYTVRSLIENLGFSSDDCVETMEHSGYIICDNNRYIISTTPVDAPECQLDHLKSILAINLASQTTVIKNIEDNSLLDSIIARSDAVTVYITEDMMEFSTYKEAVEHQSKVDHAKAVLNVIPISVGYVVLESIFLKCMDMERSEVSYVNFIDVINNNRGFATRQFDRKYKFKESLALSKLDKAIFDQEYSMDDARSILNDIAKINRMIGELNKHFWS